MLRRGADQTERLQAVPSSKSAEELTIALSDPSPHVARAGVTRLLELEGVRVAPGRTVVYALAHLEATEVTRDVGRLVDDPDPEVRFALIPAAAALHPEPAPLVRYMASDLDPAVRDSAETWLDRHEASTGGGTR